jgi:hypothetical protein
MFLFLKLVLAHLVADFILQFEELYQLKLKTVYGHFLHGVIHFFITLLLVFPYLLNIWMWVFVAAIATIHVFQDRFKYRFMESKKNYFHIFVIDQIGHILFLSTILLFPMSEHVMGFRTMPLLNYYYLNNTITLYLIAFLLGTFCGNFLFHAYAMSFNKKARKDLFITTFEIVHGIVERTVIMGIFMLSSNPIVMLACPLIGLGRLTAKPLQSLNAFLVSFAYGALVGLLFRVWI